MRDDDRHLGRLLDRLEELFEEVDAFDEPRRAAVYELLDGIDAIHRLALWRLGQELDPAATERLRAAHPAIAWLFDAYAVGVDERTVAEKALDDIRPYVHSHGGEVEVLEAGGGRVHVRLSGACSGCTASAVTLQEGVEEALRNGYPGFQELTVAPDDAEQHPPPGPTLLQIQPHPESSLSR